MFDFDFTDELKLIIKKLVKKDKKKVEIINKKVKEIINSNNDSINYYKNLRHELSGYKRVHINRNFVLVFKVDLSSNFILFVDFDHHDNVYKKKFKERKS